MNFIHSISNSKLVSHCKSSVLLVETETHDPHSSSSSSIHHHPKKKKKKKKKRKNKRNWLDLPPDVMSLILLKLGAVNILSSAQWVCSSWWKLSKQTHLFRCIHVKAIVPLFNGFLPQHSYMKISRGMAREAIDKSFGQLVEFSALGGIANDELLHHMHEKSSSLRYIRLVYCYELSSDGLNCMAKKLPQLEELEIVDDSYFSKDAIALAIAENMPELRHLNLVKNKLVTDDGLRAILDGCSRLESLDLRQCVGLKFAGDLKERCGNIKVLKLPNDPTGSYEYEL